MSNRRPPHHPHPHPFSQHQLPFQNINRVPSVSAFHDGADDGGLHWPFGRLDTLDRDELRETAYEIFFTSCRSSPGFGAPVGSTAGGGGSRNSHAHQVSDASSMDSPGRSGAGGANAGGGTGMMAVTSRLKRALGLRTRRSAPMRAMHMGSPLISPSGGGGGGGSGSTGTSGMGGGGGGGGGGSIGKAKQRPMTAAEIMRQQMGVNEQSDNRLRKTLTRSLVGQGGKKTESIVLPLELIRHLKPSEFSNAHDYHNWQRRQLKVLEAGLLLYPSVPVDRLNTAGLRFGDIMHASELKPIETGKNSEAMRTLSTCVMTLACHNQSGTPVELCHWADGYPVNIHLYLALLRSIFDHRDETVVLDEVDELLELMKRTWSTLALNRMVHNVCLTWVLFEQYITTGQIEPDLMSATLSMLIEVASDAKKHEREPGYIRVLSAAMTSMNGWAEKRLLDYFECFDKGALGMMEHVLCLALSTAKIITEDISSSGRVGVLNERENEDSISFSSQYLVEHYIRSSIRNVFTKALENSNGNNESMIVEVDEDPTKTLMHIAKETEELAMMQRDVYSPTLKRWHQAPTAVTVVTLHNCFGTLLKQYFSRVSCLTNELVRTLHMAGKLEKTLLQIGVEDSADSEDGGRGIIKEMIPFEVDSIISNLMKSWLADRLRMARECVNRAKETENWHPKSKSEPYSQSIVDLTKLVKTTVDEIFEIQVAGRDEAVADLADNLDSIFQEYISFVTSCGSKRSYIPQLPPLTRCNQDSMVVALWKKAATPCKAGVPDPGVISVRRQGDSGGAVGGPGDTPSHPRTTASRGTQRLYIRLNTLHFLLSHLHSIDKSLSFFTRHGPAPTPRTPVVATTPRRRSLGQTSFEAARSSLHNAILHVAEVAAFRLIFHDSSQSFHSLYIGSVAEARIWPTLRSLKQNLVFLLSLLTDRAQAMALREVMKASLEAFMMVLVAGGTGRAFSRSDHEMVAEDLSQLKRLFCASGEGVLAEEVVERESAAVEGVVRGLMSMHTEKLVEEFSIAACEASGLGRSLERVPMPEQSVRWHRTDPYTMLRVLCHRDDEAASKFLKRTFDLPKRR